MTNLSKNFDITESHIPVSIPQLYMKKTDVSTVV